MASIGSEPPQGLEYAYKGLIGALTPQANTTVEPEFSLLWPPGYGMINARLTSPKSAMNDRLFDYWDTTEQTLDQFANAPVSAAAFACTGASYLAGRDEEDALVTRIEEARGYPFITSAIAVTDALNTLDAKRIGLVSPYPADLTEASVGYWQSRGFHIAEISSAFNPGSDFHPIYSLQASSAQDALAHLRDKPLDAIVMLGTGMPTLAPIAGAAHWDGPPVMSCMLCLAWRTVQAIDGTPPGRNILMDWINGAGWSERLAASRPHTTETG
jgi:maleate isomerase